MEHTPLNSCIFISICALTFGVIMSKYFDKTVRGFRTKLAYHDYLKTRLHGLLSNKHRDLDFRMEYPPKEPHGIDIVGLKRILGNEREVVAIEVLGIAEETVRKGKRISAGQVGKIMMDISKLLLRSKASAKVLVFSTKEVRDHMQKIKERNLDRGYARWSEIEFYEINEFVERF